MLSRPQYSLARTSKECVDGILQGKAALFHHTLTYLIDIAPPVGRSVEQSETETVISGRHDGFVENLRENVAVVRQRVRSSNLKAIRLSVGEISKTDVVLMYIEDIVNPELVEKLKKRINDMEIDAVFETAKKRTSGDQLPPLPYDRGIYRQAAAFGHRKRYDSRSEYIQLHPGPVR
ncbi:spore germination protein [Bacillus cereus]|uniref:spore germination protein n=1 Tax=Paenibacillus TaxID=44249 RepID=UPI001BCBCE0F|nr:spore germination protein [Paenibacillus dendritiformis]MEB9897046.1 spore germination protein [Bacillus cereus]